MANADERFFKKINIMQAIQRQKLMHLWLVATLVLLFGTGLVLRPDRDVTEYLKQQHVGVYPSDVQTRQLAVHIRLLQDNGLALDQIKARLLNNGSLTAEVVNRVMRWKFAMEAKQQAEERLALFVSVALVPPLILLELGAALLWLRRGYIDWPSPTHAGPKSTTASRWTKTRSSRS